MNELLVGAWTVLTAAGGTVALGLILAIALGINAMTLLFFGSAVVALERFARVATRRGVIAACVLVWAALLGAFSLYWNADALAGADLAQWLRAFGARQRARRGARVSCSRSSCRVGLRFVAPRRLGAARARACSGSRPRSCSAAPRSSRYAAAPAIVAAAAAGVLACAAPLAPRTSVERGRADVRGARGRRSRSARRSRWRCPRRTSCVAAGRAR